MSGVLITGGAGFVATNTAARLLGEGHSVRILDDLSRPGVEDNLRWLQREYGGDRLDVEIGDVRDRAIVRRALHGARSVLHLAAQVAVTTSLDEPLHDASVNLRGTLNLLEEARDRPHPPVIVFTSTNKVYGSLSDVELRELSQRYEPVEARLRGTGIDETRPLAFCTPYGCSKGAADQYMLDWARSFRVPTVVFRMSCIYGPHQFGTEDQGWVAHFLISAMQAAPVTVYGTGKQVRDILFVDDLVDALLLAGAGTDLAGRAFNIGGGPHSTISLLELIDTVAELRGERPEVIHDVWRAGDQRYYVSDTTAFQRATGWRPKIAPAEGVERLHDWLAVHRAPLRAAA